MGDRRHARELALQALFYFDVEKGDPETMLALFRKNFWEDAGDSVEEFFMELVAGVIRELPDIDDVICRHSKHWKLSRMPVVDRNIMRIGIFELMHRPDIPQSVTINEAVEIAKKYGSRGSGPFVNGVLDSVRINEIVTVLPPDSKTQNKS